MLFKRLRTFFLLSFLICSFTAEALIQRSPAAELNAAYEKVRATVAADKGKLTEEAINQKLKEIIAPMFDFEELCRRSVGVYWSKGTAQEQKEFVDRLSDLLARTYLKRITRGVELINVEQISEKVDGDRAKVFAKVSTKGVMISTEARLHLTPGGWKIFDVAVEGIGLVENYRNEFPAIIRKEGFTGLNARLKEKQLKGSGELPVNPAKHLTPPME